MVCGACDPKGLYRVHFCLSALLCRLLLFGPACVQKPGPGAVVLLGHLHVLAYVVAWRAFGLAYSGLLCCTKDLNATQFVRRTVHCAVHVVMGRFGDVHMLCSKWSARCKLFRQAAGLCKCVQSGFGQTA